RFSMTVSVQGRLRLCAGLVLAMACSSGRSSAPSTTPVPASRSGAAEGTHTAASTGGIPVAYRLEAPEWMSRAIAHGTRTTTGVPGPNYWQQYANYRLEAELNPVLKRVTGRGRVVYYNRSPDTLPVVYIQAYQNLFREDAKRNQQTPKLG